MQLSTKHLNTNPLPATKNSNARLAQVEWRDLLSLSRTEIVRECVLSLPWLLGSLSAYHYRWFAVGAICSFYFFLTGLRQSHGAQHYAIGLSRFAHDCLMSILSLFMLASMHAVQVSHLHHHRRCLEEDDAEGAAARLPWWQALLIGPLFLARIHTTAWRAASPRKRRWIALELCGIMLVLASAAALPAFHAWRLHVVAMSLGECLSAFFAVWTVHHDCEHRLLGRTQRGRAINRFFYDMFYHAEHHYYPQVPTCRLGELAARLDRVDRTFADRQVIGWE